MFSDFCLSSLLICITFVIIGDKPTGLYIALSFWCVQWVLTPSENCWMLFSRWSWMRCEFSSDKVRLCWNYYVTLWDGDAVIVVMKCWFCSDVKGCRYSGYSSLFGIGQIFWVCIVVKPSVLCVCFLKKIRKRWLVCFLSARLIH